MSEPSAQRIWLDDIAAACDELGYLIKLVEPDRIELVPRGMMHTEITVSGYVLCGSILRELLRELPAAERKP